MSRSLRILLIGDYSNLHSTLAGQLRVLGHEVTVMSEGSYFQETTRDIDTSRRAGKLGGAILAAKCAYSWHDVMRDNDIVALISPNFVQLRPKRLRYFFDRLCGENRSVFLTAAGTDAAYVRYCTSPDSKLRYNEWQINGRPGPLAIADSVQLNEWMAPELQTYTDYVYSRLTGVVTALYEYHCAASQMVDADCLAYGGIPINTELYKPDYSLRDDENTVLFLGRHRGRYDEKGTKILETAARRAIAARSDIELKIVENVPLNEYARLQQSAHLVLDQIYSYTPATNALMAMSRGIAVMSGAEQDFYDFIGERDMRPIINAKYDADLLAQQIAMYASDLELLQAMGHQARDFVVKHNSADVVAQRYLNFWKSKL